MMKYTVVLLLDLALKASYVKKKMYKVFCVCRGSYVKSDKCPQVMSLELASVGAEDYESENE